MAPTLRDDDDQKAAARSEARAAKPGAVSVSADQAALLDQRIAEKRGQNHEVINAPQELGQLEQDLAAKQKGRAADASSKPGAFSAVPSNTRSELSDLEADVAAKQRARPGATSETCDSKVAAKIMSDSKPRSNEELNNLEAAVQSKMRSDSKPRSNEELNNLEAAVQAKMRSDSKPRSNEELNNLEAAVQAKVRSDSKPSSKDELNSFETSVQAKMCSASKPSTNVELNDLEAAVQAKMRSGVAIASVASPGARASLTSLEDEVTSKQGVGRSREELSRLDERIAAKNGEAVPFNTNTPRSFQEAEDSVLKKKSLPESPGENAATFLRDGRSPEQHLYQDKEIANPRKDEQLESGLQHGFDTPGSSGLQNIDLEYGVLGGPEEQGLAIAFAVEEDDEDMFIPSAVEYDPDAKPPIYRNRRFRLYACLSVVVVIVGTIGAAVGVALSGSTSPPQINHREILGIRESIERLVGSDQLADKASPYRKALDWIMYNDTMALVPENATFTQRYAAAYFYYATSVKKDWAGGCSPAKEGEDDNCIFHRLNGVDPPTYIDMPWKRWLSKASECDWVGVGCDEVNQFRSMEFAGMNMTGSFPAGVSLFPYLQSLMLSYGELGGSLPDSIGDMKHLVNLEIQGNMFTGSIPENWYKSRSLQRINLSVNQLSGSISKNINQLKDIKGLFVLENALTGPIPEEIGELYSTTYMRVNGNVFNGTIPSTIGNLRQLTDFWFQRNKFTGSIPTEIGFMTGLQDVRLHVNSITGSIPTELYQCTDIIRLDLFENKLTGNLTSGIGNLTQMWLLRVNRNDLTGTLPTQLGNITKLTSVVLSQNSFVGTIPSHLCDLRKNPAFSDLEADCGTQPNGTEEIQCPKGCCTMCCQDSDPGSCFAVDSTEADIHQ